MRELYSFIHRLLSASTLGIGVVLLVVMIMTLTSCQKTEKVEESTIFLSDDDEDDDEALDLDQLEENGELIAVTMYGPDTYYEWRGQTFGLQYELIADFARSQGLRIRIETARDTAEMLQMLSNSDADVIAYPMAKDDQYAFCDLKDSTSVKGWLTRKSSEELAAALNKWYKPELKRTVMERRMARFKSKYRPPKQYHPQPKVKDARRGIISIYDELFRRNSHVCGWDWRLLAAVCYQESNFNAGAVSWAGAQGLMQLMPSTAERLGIHGNVFEPEINVNGAARLIKQLNEQFSNIKDTDERINFILASYNGGRGHVLDAMALTRKYGGNAERWEDVDKYILLLSDPEYYRDPCVKYGYLRGTETSGYVSRIRSHWDYYRSVAR